MLLGESSMAVCERSKLVLKASLACRHLCQLVGLSLSIQPARAAECTGSCCATQPNMMMTASKYEITGLAANFLLYR